MKQNSWEKKNETNVLQLQEKDVGEYKVTQDLKYLKTKYNTLKSRPLGAQFSESSKGTSIQKSVKSDSQVGTKEIFPSSILKEKNKYRAENACSQNTGWW